MERDYGTIARSTREIINTVILKYHAVVMNDTSASANELLRMQAEQIQQLKEQLELQAEKEETKGEEATQKRRKEGTQED